MPEHLARQQLFAESRAVHDGKRTLTAGALPMEGPGQNGLAGAAFAAQEDRDVVRGGAADHVEHRAHGGARGGEHHFRRGTGELLLEVGDAPGQVHPRASLFDRALDLGRCERLRQVVARPAADRLHRRVDGGVRGDDDDLERRTLGKKRTEKIETAFPPEPQIDECEIVRQARQRLDGGRRRAALRDRAAQRFQADGERLADVAFVVDDQDSHRTPGGVRLVVQCGSPGGENAPARRLRSRPQCHSIIPANSAPRKHAPDAAAIGVRRRSGIGTQNKSAESASRCTRRFRSAR